MAKKAKSTPAGDGVNVALLQSIATATAQDSVVYVGKLPEVELLITKDFIVINTEMPDPSDPMKVASKITDTGVEYLKNMNTVQSKPVEASSEGFAIISNAVLPASKRGNKGGGAPTIYPFDKMEIGQSFFVPKSDKHPDPVKTLGSTVSSANMRFAEETNETETVERTKRGSDHKAVVDEHGNKVKETVTRKKMKLTRKFSLRSVKQGEKYGDWVAPADGALIARVPIE